MERERAKQTKAPRYLVLYPYFFSRFSFSSLEALSGAGNEGVGLCTWENFLANKWQKPGDVESICMYLLHIAVVTSSHSEQYNIRVLRILKPPSSKVPLADCTSIELEHCPVHGVMEYAHDCWRCSKIVFDSENTLAISLSKGSLSRDGFTKFLGSRFCLEG